ncbi:MAG TPA: amidohydrolase [Lentimicrobium sp.]|jgi:predicted amidohydrolase|nr:amidohydrolase [Lentimicrobium sp.]
MALPLKVILIQAPLVWADKIANLNYFTNQLNKIEKDTDLIILPEMFATGFVTEVIEIAEDTGGPVFQWLSEQSKKQNAVITGSIAVKEGNNYYNRLIWMRPDGSYEIYDKRHLFRMGNEHLNFSQGSKPLIIELKGWKIRPLVCYDLRFPVWSKNRLINDGYEYDVLIYVANWPASRCYAWQTLLAARAIENQAYCIGVNRIGIDGKGIPYKGGSVILDFKGKRQSGCDDDKAQLLTGILDYDSLIHYREQFKVALDWDTFNINY